jgi:hypothetical protein
VAHELASPCKSRGQIREWQEGPTYPGAAKVN